MGLRLPIVNQVLQKFLLHFDLFDFEPQIAVEMYATPIHLGKYSIASLSMEIVICNYAFFKDP
jgi:hypothetical protein